MYGVCKCVCVCQRELFCFGLLLFPKQQKNNTNKEAFDWPDCLDMSLFLWVINLKDLATPIRNETPVAGAGAAAITGA